MRNTDRMIRDGIAAEVLARHPSTTYHDTPERAAEWTKALRLAGWARDIFAGTALVITLQ